MAYQQISLGEFKALVRTRLGAASSTFWRDDELNRYIQEALLMWNALTGMWKTRVVLTTTANTSWYSVPGTITSTMRVSFNDSPLGPTSLPELDWGRQYWESETTADAGAVPTAPQLWAPAAVNLIAIWPADSFGQNSLVLDGVAQTPQLYDDDGFNDAFDMDIGQEEVNALLDYVEHIAVFKEGGQEFSDTTPLFQNFLKMAGERNAMLLSSSKYRMWMGLDKSEDERPRKASERTGIR